MSWIMLEDVVAIIRTALVKDNLRGPINLVSPDAIRNADFTQSLAKAMRRPAIFKVPAFGLRLALGEMSNIVLASTRVVPQVLQQHGYSFLRPHLDEALRTIVR
jgi:NAD dependent epimerase/dehydratase family enzyme